MTQEPSFEEMLQDEENETRRVQDKLGEQERTPEDKARVREIMARTKKDLIARGVLK